MEKKIIVPTLLKGVIKESHFYDLNVVSGITAQTIAENNLKSLNEDEVRSSLGLNSSVGAGLIFPYWESMDKSMKDVFSIRLDVPVVGRDGKEKRYLRRRGSRVRPYIPKKTFKILDNILIPLFFPEGEKKALLLTQYDYHAVAFSGIWNFLSQKKPLKELRNIKLNGRKVYICYDGDKELNPQVILAQDRLAQTLIDLGADVNVINMPMGEKPDEFIVKHGSEAFKKLVDQAVGYESRQKPEIIIPSNDVVYFAQKAVEEINKENKENPFIFLQGNQPVRIEFDSEGRPMVVNLNEDRLRYHLCRLVKWTTYSKAGELVLTIPSLTYIRDILATPQHGFPPLKGISQSPLFTKEGILECQQGYSWKSGLYHSYPKSLQSFSINPNPSDEEMKKAKDFILNNLFFDFPFVSQADLTHAFILLFLPFMRDMIFGPCPLFLLEKSTPGTGAGLLIECIALICTGYSYTALPESHNEEELRKRITAVLRNFPPLVVIDNLSKELNSGILASLLTRSEWDDRLLGKTEHIHIPVRGIFVATANNPRLSDEIARRTIRSRMDAKVENPHLRDPNFFKHPEILKWARENRTNFVRAIFTLIQFWISKGMPKSKKSLGMYEDWAAKCGGLLETIKVGGFLDNLKDFYSEVNTEKENLKAFISHWYSTFRTEEVVAGSLFKLIRDNESINIDLGSSNNERSQRTRLGYILASLKDRIFEIENKSLLLTLKVRKSKRVINHTTAYYLEICDTGMAHSITKEGKIKIKVKGRSGRLGRLINEA